MTLDLFDVAGRSRGVLASRHFAAGRHELAQTVSALRGAGSSAGILFRRLRFEEETVVHRVVLVR